MTKIYNEIYEALNNSIENGYEHPWHKQPLEIVQEINEQTGIVDYYELDSPEVREAVDGVIGWRYDNDPTR